MLGPVRDELRDEEADLLFTSGRDLGVLGEVVIQRRRSRFLRANDEERRLRVIAGKNGNLSGSRGDCQLGKRTV